MGGIRQPGPGHGVREAVEGGQDIGQNILVHREEHGFHTSDAGPDQRLAQLEESLESTSPQREWIPQQGLGPGHRVQPPLGDPHETGRLRPRQDEVEARQVGGGPYRGGGVADVQLLHELARVGHPQPAGYW